jgi:cell division septum initiation protein DivIVA
MRILTAAVVIGPLMLIGGPPAAAHSTRAPGSSAPTQSAAVAGSSTIDRDSYAHEARDAVRHWQRKLRDFRKQAKADGEKAGSATEKGLHEAWAKADAASRKLQNIGAKNWAKAKTSYEQASRELTAAWDKDRPRGK